MSPQKKEQEKKKEPEEKKEPEDKLAESVGKESKETEKKPIQHAKFSEIDASEGLDTKMGNIVGLLDVPMKVSVKLGGTTLSIQELLNVGPGSVLTLDNVAGGSVEILVNNKIFARGEVVVVDENFGVRIISLVSQEELVRKMGD